jgi:putative membrane protein
MMYRGDVGFGGLFGLFWLLLLVLGVVIVVAAIVALFRGRGAWNGQGQHWSAPPTTPQAPRPEPLEILRERYARGEITADEFETAKRILGYGS